MKPIARIHSGSEYMDLYADGKIGRTCCEPSGQWICTGAVQYNNFGRVIRRYTLDQVINGNLAWRHKNGKQRIHLCDLDHGTHRTWMNPTHEVYKL